MPPTCRPLVPRKAVDTASLKNWTWDIGCEILLWVDQQLAARTHPNSRVRAEVVNGDAYCSEQYTGPECQLCIDGVPLWGGVHTPPLVSYEPDDELRVK